MADLKGMLASCSSALQFCDVFEGVKWKNRCRESGVRAAPSRNTDGEVARMILRRRRQITGMETASADARCQLTVKSGLSFRPGPSRPAGSSRSVTGSLPSPINRIPARVDAVLPPTNTSKPPSTFSGIDSHHNRLRAPKRPAILPFDWIGVTQPPAELTAILSAPASADLPPHPQKAGGSPRPIRGNGTKSDLEPCCGLRASNVPRLPLVAV